MTNFLHLDRAIKKLRLLRGLTGSALANRAGISKSMLSGYEHGKILPSVPTLFKILRALDASLVDLEVAMIASQRGRAAELPAPDPRAGSQPSLRLAMLAGLADELEALGRRALAVARMLRSALAALDKWAPKNSG